MADEHKKESLKDKILHPHKHHEGEQGTEAKAEDGKGHEGKHHDGHKKESLLQRYEDYAAEENLKEDRDDIWGKGPHVG